MDDAALVELLPGLLSDHWQVEAGTVEPLGGGMNSTTALVRAGTRQYVAKWSRETGSLESGCRAARLAARAGVPTGAPVAATGARNVVPLAGGALALLAHVPGRELEGESAREQALIGTTLGRAHLAGGPERHTGGFLTAWLSPASEVLAVAAWLPDALRAVRDEYATLPPLTWTQLHTDPSPQAFLHDEATGTTGLIDWSGSCRGPVLYDVASAVMYLGGTDRAGAFLATYLASDVLEAGELEHLDAFRRLRWGVQASYFAGRIVVDDQTGVTDDPGHNLEALARARRGLDEVQPVRPGGVTTAVSRTPPP